MAENPAVTEALRVVAAFGLDEIGASPISFDQQQWSEFAARVHAERLTGLAAAAARAGRLDLTEAQETQLKSEQRRAMLCALHLERRLLELGDRLEGAGIEFVVLKGAGLAHSFYPHPALRSFGDLDVLVGTEDWRRSCEVLAEAGYQRRLPEPRPGFDVRFGKAAMHRALDGVEVDLHQRLVVGPYGLQIDPLELRSRPAWFRVGGVFLRRFDDTAMLLHVCIHASLGTEIPRLAPLRDIAQVLRGGAIDWDRLGKWAGAWQCRAVLSHALRASSATLGIQLPAEAGRLLVERPDRRERRALAAYTTERRRRGGTAMSTLRAIPGLPAKSAYVRAMLFPDAGFLAARAGRANSPSYLNRWRTPLRWVARR